MKAVESSLSKFLEGTKQFIIPIYQRTYSWHRSHCEQLWNDIIKMADDETIPGHFIGSIVYISKGLHNVASVEKLLVIDGQQRLTTLLLLLSALSEKFEEVEGKESKTKKKIHNKFIFNNDEDQNDKYKLILTQSDKPTFNSLINNGTLPKDKSEKVINNYEYFRMQINKSNLDLELLYSTILKLFIVDVSLDREHDNPQLIFESLNSTGLDLSQADLIRNFILMGQEQKLQEELYNEYWYPMEQSFNLDESGENFDGFMRDYLTIKLGRIPTFGNIYKEFKKYFFNLSHKGVDKIVADIKYFSQFYIKIAFQNSGDKKLDEIFKNIESLKVWVAYPFFIEVYNDYHQEVITKEGFINILKTIESYVFRRAIVGIPTNSLNKTFANLYKTVDKDNYIESITAALQMMDSYRRFPSDDEFMSELCVKDVYNMRSRNYLLGKLENYDHKEKILVEDYTIEHIMPQNKNLSEPWQEMLGDNWKDIQKKYLHTIGNLTLTGYNSELSDRPFIEKRDMKGGFKDSHLRLNDDLGTMNEWNENKISDRAFRLAEKSIKVWAWDPLPELVLDKYKIDEEEEIKYTIDQFSNSLQGEMLNLFNLLRKRILNLDSSVKEEFKKLYIAYKNITNFVDIIPQKSKLWLTLNLEFEEINDPKNICQDVTEKGMWGNGDIRVSIAKPDEIEYIMFLIKQSFSKHAENNGT